MAHLNPLQLVLVGTVLEISCFLTQVPTGVLADVYSRRLAVIIGIFLIGAGFILEGAIPRFETILLAQVIWGVGATCTDGADSAWIADEIGEERVGNAFLRAAQVGQAAALIAIPLSVAFGSVRLNLPILLGGGLYLLLGVFLIFFMPEQGFKPTPREDRTSWQAMADTTRDGVRLIRRRPILLTFLGITLLYGAFSEGFDRLQVAHLVDNFRFPALGSFQPVVWFGIISAGIHAAVHWRDGGRPATAGYEPSPAGGLGAVCVYRVAQRQRGGFCAGRELLPGAGGPLERERSFARYGCRSSAPGRRRASTRRCGQRCCLSTARPTRWARLRAARRWARLRTFGSLRAALTLAGAILAPALLLFVRAGRQGRAAAPAAEEPVAAVER